MLSGTHQQHFVRLRHGKARRACMQRALQRRLVLGKAIVTDMETNLLQGRFVIPAEEAQQSLLAHGSNPEQGHDSVYKYLMSLVEPASALARPPISKFHVGAVGLGSSGAIYVGVNVEFPGGHLNNSIHAEQFLLLNCLLHGEHGIQVLAVSEAPCGHCRQFYAETATADTVQFVFGTGSHWLHSHQHKSHSSNGNSQASAAAVHGSHKGSKKSPAGAEPRPLAAYTLNQLLPARFGPGDLMTDGQVFPLLLQPQHNAVQLSSQALQQLDAAQQQGNEAFVKAAQLAEKWAQKSYAPYTKSASGAAIITRDGHVYGGGYVESAAFNPSLTPFHAAWVAALVGGIDGFDQIEHVVLVEHPDAPVQHEHGITALLRSVSPAATVTSLHLQSN